MELDFRQIFASRFSETGGSLKVRSAVNPLLWLSALISAPAFFAAVWNPALPFWVASILTFAAVAPPLATLASYFYLLFRDPGKLQSEEYQLRHEALQMIGQNNWPEAVVGLVERVVTPDQLPSPTTLKEGQ